MAIHVCRNVLLVVRTCIGRLHRPSSITSEIELDLGNAAGQQAVQGTDNIFSIQKRVTENVACSGF